MTLCHLSVCPPYLNMLSSFKHATCVFWIAIVISKASSMAEIDTSNNNLPNFTSLPKFKCIGSFCTFSAFGDLWVNDQYRNVWIHPNLRQIIGCQCTEVSICICTYTNSNTNLVFVKWHSCYASTFLYSLVSLVCAAFVVQMHSSLCKGSSLCEA